LKFGGIPAQGGRDSLPACIQAYDSEQHDSPKSGANRPLRPDRWRTPLQKVVFVLDHGSWVVHPSYYVIHSRRGGSGGYGRWCGYGRHSDQGL